MKMRPLPNLGCLLAIALIGFSVFEAQARVIRYRHGPRYRYRAPRPQPPPKPPKPPKPKTLSASGTVMGLNVSAKTLSITDDNTRSTLNLVITPQTTFTRNNKAILPAAIRTYEHVTVSYQDTDSTVKAVKVTPKPGSATAPAPKPKAGKVQKKQ